MTGKKIEFSKKPSIKETNQFIDNWVSGNIISNESDKKLKRTTIYLPEDLHKRLKIMAANTETSMTDIIINTLEKYVK
jgi:predicted HicB family RNase H-like nuclease